MDSHLSFDSKKCIICQDVIGLDPISRPDGREKIKTAASMRKDIVEKRLKMIGDDFVYHMNKKCYKVYTMKQTVKSIAEKQEEEVIASNLLNEIDETEQPLRKRTR